MNDEPTENSEEEAGGAPFADVPEGGARGFTLGESEETDGREDIPDENASLPEGSEEEAAKDEGPGVDGDASDDDAPDDGESEGDGDEAGEEEADENGVSPLPVTAIVEAVLFAAREPLKLAQIARAVGKRTRQDAVRAAIDELNVQYLETSRAFEIAEISGRFQLMSRPEYADHIMRIYPKRELADKETKSQRLTPAMLDTLAIVAYKQPVMRSEIEHIRGVACGPVLRSLIERGSVREVGRRADLVGKPAVFGTTERFLAEFGLGSIEELPMRNEFITPGLESQVEMNVVQPGENRDEGVEEEDNPSEENLPGNENAASEIPEDSAAPEPVETEDGDDEEDVDAAPETIASEEEDDAMQEAEDELSDE